jgi:hypothetical protein
LADAEMPAFAALAQRIAIRKRLGFGSSIGAMPV